MSVSDKSISDKDLVEGIKKGNANSFKTLYYRYYKQLINFVYFRLHSEELSSDFVQEIFSKLWINRNSLNKNKSIKAFLYKSLNNLIIDHYKSSSSKNESLSEKKFNDLSAPELDIENQIDIQNAVAHLPEKLKLVYTLSRYDGYSYSEISKICEISVKAVEKRMSKTFTILRKYFS